MGIGSFVKRQAQPISSPTVRTRASGGDLILVTAVVALLLFGLLMLYSASADFSQRTYNSPTLIFNKQLIFMVVGIVAAIILSSINYHHWRRLAIPLMMLTIILLVTVLIRNEVRNHAVRTIYNGSGQPSELAKLATIIYLSIWLFSKQDQMHVFQLGLFPLAIILGVIGGLIFLQPDFSAALTVFILGGLLFFLAGGELRQILVFSLIMLLAGWIVVRFTPTGKARIGPYLAGLKDPLKSSDQVVWGLDAIYKGKLIGVGIGNATTKLIGLPEAYTDSIFAVVVEELGLLGAVTLICLYGILLWRGMVIAAKAPDMLGAILAYGITFWIVLEALINITVMVGLIPFAGNALPFVSAGGSNLASVLAAVGILLSISRHSGQKVQAENEERRSYSASLDLRRRNRRRSVSRPGSSASHPG